MIGRGSKCHSRRHRICPSWGPSIQMCVSQMQQFAWKDKMLPCCQPPESVYEKSRQKNSVCLFFTWGVEIRASTPRLGIKPRAPPRTLGMLGKCSPTEQPLSPSPELPEVPVYPDHGRPVILMTVSMCTLRLECMRPSEIHMPEWDSQPPEGGLVMRAPTLAGTSALITGCQRTQQHSFISTASTTWAHCFSSTPLVTCEHNEKAQILDRHQVSLCLGHVPPASSTARSIFLFSSTHSGEGILFQQQEDTKIVCVQN